MCQTKCYGPDIARPDSPRYRKLYLEDAGTSLPDVVLIIIALGQICRVAAGMIGTQTLACSCAWCLCFLCNSWSRAKHTACISGGSQYVQEHKAQGFMESRINAAGTLYRHLLQLLHELLMRMNGMVVNSPDSF